MNVYRIGLFLFIVQMSIMVVSFAELPLACDSSWNCKYFDTTTQSGTSAYDEMSSYIEGGKYQTTQISTDIYNVEQAPLVLTMLSKLTYSVLWGVAGTVTYFLGYNLVTLAIGVLLQGIVYYFYIVSIMGIVKLAGVDI